MKLTVYILQGQSYQDEHLISSRSAHSHKILSIQQGQPRYLSILSNPCSDQEESQAGRENMHLKFPELNPVDACRGFPTELTPQG